jgi:hypothetical protein
MTYFDKFLMQGLSKYYKKIMMVLKYFLKKNSKEFKEYSRNIF